MTKQRVAKKPSKTKTVQSVFLSLGLTSVPYSHGVVLTSYFVEFIPGNKTEGDKGSRQKRRLQSGCPRDSARSRFLLIQKPRTTRKVSGKLPTIKRNALTRTQLYLPLSLDASLRFLDHKLTKYQNEIKPANSKLNICVISRKAPVIHSKDADSTSLPFLTFKGPTLTSCVFLHTISKSRGFSVNFMDISDHFRIIYYKRDICILHPYLF